MHLKCVHVQKLLKEFYNFLCLASSSGISMIHPLFYLHYLRMLQLTDDPVSNFLGLGRDVEHVKVDDAAHDPVPPQIQLKLITFHLIFIGVIIQ